MAALALGGFFFVPGRRSALFAGFSAVMSTVVYSGVASFLAPVGATCFGCCCLRLFLLLPSRFEFCIDVRMLLAQV